MLSCNFWESVVRNAMPLTNITSTVITTNQWRQWKSSGMCPGSASTCSGLQRMVFLRTPVMLGPKMEQALVMCLGLMGQFLMVLFLTIFKNWASVGWPVMAWALRAAMASCSAQRRCRPLVRRRRVGVAGRRTYTGPQAGGLCRRCRGPCRIP